jgi:ABC-type proline/glycine betaine transport system permease subunit
MTTCQTLTGVPAGVLMAPLNQMASTVNNQLDLLQKDLQNITSKDNFTI